MSYHFRSCLVLRSVCQHSRVCCLDLVPPHQHLLPSRFRRMEIYFQPKIRLRVSQRVPSDLYFQSLVVLKRRASPPPCHHGTHHPAPQPQIVFPLWKSLLAG